MLEHKLSHALRQIGHNRIRGAGRYGLEADDCRVITSWVRDRDRYADKVKFVRRHGHTRSEYLVRYEKVEVLVRVIYDELTRQLATILPPLEASNG